MNIKIIFLQVRLYANEEKYSRKTIFFNILVLESCSQFKVRMPKNVLF